MGIDPCLQYSAGPRPALRGRVCTGDGAYPWRDRGRIGRRTACAVTVVVSFLSASKTRDEILGCASALDERLPGCLPCPGAGAGEPATPVSVRRATDLQSVLAEYHGRDGGHGGVRRHGQRKPSR